ncbi:HNH endonuclease [Streptomyces sp. MB09-02B]|uniref:HNH endonuclease n=1 Tax=Streptomyces sp. MB09-02B TaxID=3028667 RepID=UPI0029BA17C7|nr:HNH endonuclease [Streptomyces sp. MB09-02B]MDX3645838.1 HNH endonuclease [Streptomyces sp. MB09-02B]
MAVSKRLRYEILRRDNHTCRYCGASAPDAPLRVDHVTPVALGGSDKPENLVTSCEPCNSGKSSATVDSAVVADVDATAVRWADAMKQAAENLRQQQTPKDEYRDAFLAEWNRWGHGEGEARTTVELPADWKPSIERFRVAGLPADVWSDIVDTAMGYEKVLTVNKFKYCCGIAWNKVAELQAEARKIVGSAPSAAAFDIENPDDLVLEAALLTWGQDWTCTFKGGPTAEQVAQFKSSAAQALASGRSLPDILHAAEYAVMFESADIAEGIEQRKSAAEFEQQYVASLVFEYAWTQASGGEQPPQKVRDQAWNSCVALYKHGLHPVHVIAAAAFAGTHLTPVLHWGLHGTDALKAVTDLPGYQHAEDLWARSWRYAGPTPAWPTDEDRWAFRASLDSVHDANRYRYADVYAAAVRAGAYRDHDPSPHLTITTDALAAAGLLFDGGDN